MEYKESVLLKVVIVRVLIEVGLIFGWERYVGFKGKSIGIDCFGVSVFVGILYKEFGFIVENFLVKVKEVMGV